MIETSYLAWVNKPSTTGPVASVTANFGLDPIWRIKTRGALFDKNIPAQIVAVDNTLNSNNVIVTVNAVPSLISGATRLNIPLSNSTVYIDATALLGNITFNFYADPHDAIPDQPNWQQLIAATVAASRVNNGNCRLDLQGANLILNPRDGDSLFINGRAETVPALVVQLGTGGLLANTDYYIYAFMNPAMTLEASIIGHAVFTDGTEVKIGDPTRALVGMAHTTAGINWADSNAQRFVLSWFNRMNKRTDAAFTANRASAGAPALLNAEIQTEWMTWANELVEFHDHLIVQNNTAGAQSLSETMVDGVTGQDNVLQTMAPANGYQLVMSNSFVNTFNEGYHYSAPWLWNLAGASTWIGGAGVGNIRCKSQVIIRG